MNKKIFIDINVVIDFLDRSRSRHEQAIKLFRYLTEEGYILCISEDMLTTIFYILKNKTLALEFLNMAVEKWQVIHFGKEIIKEAIKICLENNLDLEDVLQCLCARENNCIMLLTNDVQFYNCGIDVHTVEQFLKSL